MGLDGRSGEFLKMAERSLKDILGEAYGLHQLQRDRAAAVSLVADWVRENDAHRTEAAQDVERIEALIRARGQRVDHISTVCLDILRGALAA